MAYSIEQPLSFIKMYTLAYQRRVSVSTSLSSWSVSVCIVVLKCFSGFVDGV